MRDRTSVKDDSIEVLSSPSQQAAAADSPPRFARPEPDTQQGCQPALQQQQQQQQPQQTGAPPLSVSHQPQQRPEATAKEGGTPPPWQQQPPPSNVVEIDDVEVSPIDDPFYDPTDPINSRHSNTGPPSLADDSTAAAAKQPRTNAVAIDDVDFEGFAAPLLDEAEAASSQQQAPPGTSSAAAAATAAAPQQQAAAVPRLLLGGRPAGDSSMPDFPSGGLDLVQHLNLDGIILQNKSYVTHEGKGPPIRVPLQERQQQQQQDRHKQRKQDAADQDQQQQQQVESPRRSGSGSRPQQGKAYRSQQHKQTAATSSSSSHAGKRQQQKHQQQEEEGAPQPRASQPRPHPFYVKPRHVKKHFKVTTVDGWKLHLIRTQVVNAPATHHHPIILCPGLGSSGAYSFDLSPNVSLADYLAGKGWDVWTCELRGNGLSDKPALFSSRSSTWTIDDYVEKDVPAIIRFVQKETKAPQVHFLGHSMGGMILCGVMARVDITTAKIRSCICMGSGLFLEDSWWRLFDRFRFLLNKLWVVPTGSLLRAYSRFMFGPYRLPYIDALYFWDSNVDHRVGRAMMQRNFSNVSVGVLKQMVTAFGSKGLLSHDHKMVYADPGRLAKVTAPALFLVGDRDRMCPPEGCRKTWQMLGSRDKRYICLGPASGFADHYGHFDILMGKRVETEVFPIIHQFLLQHDSLRPRL